MTSAHPQGVTMDSEDNGTMGEPTLGSDGSPESPAGPLSDALPPPSPDELELSVIEGLAEEDTTRASTHVDAGGPPTHRMGAPAEEISNLVTAVQGLGEQLARRLDSLQTLFERELRAEAARERVIDRLHAELQEYKQDLMLKVQRPIFLDMIQLHDDIGKMIDARPPGDADASRVEATRGLLESIQTAIEDILYRQGVEPFTVEGEGFDPRRQRAVATVPAEVPGRSKSIAARLRKGFQAGEKVIRPEIVSVYTFRPTSPASPLPTTPEEIRPDHVHDVGS